MLSFREWHLLAYERFLPGEFSQDVRDIVEAFPSTVEISVLAPNLSEDLLLRLAADSGAQFRVRGTDVFLSVVSFDVRSGAIHCKPIDRGSLRDAELPKQTQEAWLFDMFHRHRGLVRSPDGIHFGKTSGKHSLFFLRAANCLVGSVEASVLAYFILPFACKQFPSTIYVDTGPLVALGLSLIKHCMQLGIWETSPDVRSFSSYDRLDLFSTATPDHMVLISASTSGGLATEIAAYTGRAQQICTVFYLQAKSQPTSSGYHVANLTQLPDSLYGYEPVETYSGF